jgi:hypothetical protein
MLDICFRPGNMLSELNIIISMAFWEPAVSTSFSPEMWEKVIKSHCLIDLSTLRLKNDPKTFPMIYTLSIFKEIQVEPMFTFM